MPRGVGGARDRVLAAAAALVDEAGPDALTLAAVADRLGIRPPSLFKHVAGLDDLRVRVAAQAFADLAAALDAAPEGADPKATVRSLAAAWRRYALAHPGVYRLASRTSFTDHPDQQAALAAPLERILGVVGRLTGPGAPAVHGTRALRALVHGFVLLEQDGGFGLDVPVEASFAAAVDALIRGF